MYGNTQQEYNTTERLHFFFSSVKKNNNTKEYRFICKDIYVTNSTIDTCNFFKKVETYKSNLLRYFKW